MRIRELIEHLQTYDPDAPVAAGIWLSDDVTCRARELGVSLTEEQTADILAEIHHGHDANHGIAWHTLDYHIENMAEE